MSTIIVTLKDTGEKDVDLDITRYYGGNKKEVMYQLTQGLGGIDTPGHIQLTVQDMKTLIKELEKLII